MKSTPQEDVVTLFIAHIIKAGGAAEAIDYHLENLQSTVAAGSFTAAIADRLARTLMERWKSGAAERKTRRLLSEIIKSAATHNSGQTDCTCDTVFSHIRHKANELLKDLDDKS